MKILKGILYLIFTLPMIPILILIAYHIYYRILNHTDIVELVIQHENGEDIPQKVVNILKEYVIKYETLIVCTTIILWYIIITQLIL